MLRHSHMKSTWLAHRTTLARRTSSLSLGAVSSVHSRLFCSNNAIQEDIDASRMKKKKFPEDSHERGMDEVAMKEGSSLKRVSGESLLNWLSPPSYLTALRICRTFFKKDNLVNRSRCLMYVCWSNLGLSSNQSQNWTRALMKDCEVRRNKEIQLTIINPTNIKKNSINESESSSSSMKKKSPTAVITKQEAKDALMEGLKEYSIACKEYNPEPSPNLSLKNPETWYPKARSIRRRIIYHCGPTNSGKTHHALQRLKESKNGVYCAPLRLLAWEIFERLSKENVECNLETGEEHWIKQGATHTCCTIEMCNLDKEYDVAVIDEVQMMSQCSQRGGSWTHALLGVCAKEIHICGDESIKDLLHKLLVDRCGDLLEIHEYNRLCPLNVDRPLMDYSQIEKGDCIVAFNRVDLFRIKTQIEQQTEFKCALVYGRLPPSNRRTQAKLFNSEFLLDGTNNRMINGTHKGKSSSSSSLSSSSSSSSSNQAKYEVMVASNAIGMGLNLNIRRIVFSSVKKFNGFSDAYLDTSEVLQIGGRAGRFGIYDQGYVTAMTGRDYGFVTKQLQKRPSLAQKAYLRPQESHICMVASKYPWLKFADILRCFQHRDRATVDDEFDIPDLSANIKIAEVLSDIPLSAKDLWIFTTVPTKSSDLRSIAFIQNWALNVAHDKVVTLDIDEKQCLEWATWNKNFDGKIDPLYAEQLYNILSIYNYLRWRFPMFVDGEKCELMLAKTAQLIQNGFDQITIDNKRLWLENTGVIF